MARYILELQKQEPVAWIVGEATLYNSDTVEAYARRSGLPVTPLYTTPPVVTNNAGGADDAS
ncbi:MULTISPECIES: hypothetical protein [Dickeya]|uniref:Uncharacterized protein n=1 Tax=Dickeya aquatica TaxID=1401087 RepID=A0A375A9C6_9GAMM|nr:MULTISPECIES: hypothetical protein [Dickeya]SLM62653.1 hypothetical protein DAQ1742_01711 [Dickeya aquatica]